jgi:hypothetical protein
LHHQPCCSIPLRAHWRWQFSYCWILCSSITGTNKCGEGEAEEEANSDIPCRVINVWPAEDAGPGEHGILEAGGENTRHYIDEGNTQGHYASSQSVGEDSKKRRGRKFTQIIRKRWWIK